MNHHPPAQFNKELWLTPISIILGSLIIAWSIQTDTQTTSSKLVTTTSTITNTAPSANLKNIRPISPSDHVLGNRNAKIVLVEYSDTECPYCKTYHKSLHQLVDVYGNDIAWVYRHNPLDIHPKAQKEAEALECAAELGGNEKFWAYIDRLFEVTPSNNRLDLAELPKIATYVGLNEKTFNDCLASGKHAARVLKDQKEIKEAGQTGTPSSVLMTKSGNMGIRGAVSYESLESKIKEALK